MILIVSVLVNTVVYIYGPIRFIPNPVQVNDEYFAILTLQYIYEGTILSLYIYIFGRLFRLSYFNIFITILLAGIVNNLLNQSGDPDFIDYYFSDLVEFLLPYLVGAMGMLAILSFGHLLYLKARKV